MSWFNKLSEFNAQQPETRIFKVTMKSPGGTYTTFNVYKNGKYDLGMSEKLTWLHAQQGITDLINLLGEISPVYDGVRFFVGVDPVTGKRFPWRNGCKLDFGLL
ncbi:pre-toxin TG domain-containing protein [Enterococcus termitis]